MNKFFLTLSLLIFSCSLQAQEVLCNIRVIPKNDIPISDRQKLQTLQKSEGVYQ